MASIACSKSRGEATDLSPCCHFGVHAVRRFMAGIVSLFALACTHPDVAVPPSQPKTPPGRVDSFYASVGEATLTGAVSSLVANPPQEEVRTLLEVDFESGKLEGFDVLQSKANKTRAGAIAKVEKLPDGNQVLKLTPAPSGPTFLRSGPIPVLPGTRYTVRWKVSTQELSVPNSAMNRYGSLEAVFYGIPDHHHNANRYLADEGNRSRDRIQLTEGPVTQSPTPPASLRYAVGPQVTGSTDMTERSLEVEPPPKANFMVLSLDLARTHTDGAVSGKVTGAVRFDDIKVTSSGRPLYKKYANPDDADAPHPLKVRVELPSPDRGAETREAIYAPTRSSLTFKRTLPAEAVFSFAVGVAREGWLDGHGGVKFMVKVHPASGAEKKVFDKTLWPGRVEVDRQWYAQRVDLSAFANQEVTLELITQAGNPEYENDFPGAAALWGDPVLFSKSGKGRLVVMTVIDAVSTRHVTTYGYDRDTMMNLDRIGRRGVIFEKAYSAAPWTLPSFSSLFTGIDAARHGAGERAWNELVWRRPLAEHYVTLAERFRREGFHTFALMNNPYLTTAFGTAQGFMTHRDYGVGTSTGAGEKGIDQAIEWLTAHQGHDRFLVVHLMDAHGPYRPPSGFAKHYMSGDYKGRFEERMGGQDYLDLAEGKKPALDEAERQQVRDLYDGALRYADSETGRFYDWVLDNAGTTDVTFIVTSDHGEELWEHGGYEHGHQAYEEMLRVPLVMENPARIKGGARVSAEVRLTDLVPTLCDLLELEVPQGLDAVSLAPLLSGGKVPWEGTRAIFAENELYGSSMSTVMRWPFKYIYNMAASSKPERRPKSVSRHELYNLDADPGETSSVSLKEPGVQSELHVLEEAHMLPVMAGRYVVVLDGGGEEKKFEGTLILPDRERWFIYYEDLIAPLKDGREAPFKLVNNRGKLDFTVQSSRALLSFKPQYSSVGEPPPVRFSLNVNDSPWRDGVLLRGGELSGVGELEVSLTDAQLLVEPSALPGPVQGKVQVFLGRTPERKVTAEQQRALSEDTAARLRALGYLKEGEENAPLPTDPSSGSGSATGSATGPATGSATGPATGPGAQSGPTSKPAAGKH